MHFIVQLAMGEPYLSIYFRVKTVDTEFAAYC